MITYFLDYIWVCYILLVMWIYYDLSCSYYGNKNNKNNKKIKLKNINKSKRIYESNNIVYEYNVKNYTNKKNLILALNNNPLIFSKICDPSYDVVCHALYMNGKNLKYCEKYFDMTLLYEIAIESNGLALKYIPEQLWDLYIMDAIKSNSRVLKYIDNQTEEMCLQAISPHSCVKYIKVFTDDVKNKLVETDGLYLKYIKKAYQTDELCKKAILQNPLAIKYKKI